MSRSENTQWAVVAVLALILGILPSIIWGLR